MYSKTHFAMSAALGLAIALAVGASLPTTAWLVGYAAFVGVAIDLDHFVIARLRTGDWSSLRFALANPAAALLDQDRIFAEGDVGSLTRLASHAAIGAVAVAALWPFDRFLATVTGVVVAVHLASDVVHEAGKSPPAQSS